jgi:hypothetical protein
MTHTIFHAQSSVRSFGGKLEDYLGVHDWLVLIWTVRQVRSELSCSATIGREPLLSGLPYLHQTESGAAGTRSSNSTVDMPLEGL